MRALAAFDVVAGTVCLPLLTAAIEVRGGVEQVRLRYAVRSEGRPDAVNIEEAVRILRQPKGLRRVCALPRRRFRWWPSWLRCWFRYSFGALAEVPVVAEVALPRSPCRSSLLFWFFTLDCVICFEIRILRHTP